MKCLLKDHEEDGWSSVAGHIKWIAAYIFIQACSWMSVGSEIVMAMRSLRTPLLTSPAPCSFCYCATVIFTITINAICEENRKGNDC